MAGGVRALVLEAGQSDAAYVSESRLEIDLRIHTLKYQKCLKESKKKNPERTHFWVETCPDKM
jgi:hypothetical protein